MTRTTPDQTTSIQTTQRPTHHQPPHDPEGNPMTILEIDPRPPSTTASVETPVAFGTTDLASVNDDWQASAQCATVSNAADLFFSEELGEIASAKRICAECPVIAPCLEAAIRRGEPWGVWGGQLFYNGRILANKRRRGRPPKNPRPEDQLPEVPIPEHLQRLIA